MNPIGWLQPVIYLAVLLALVKPLGSYMARVYQGERTFLSRILTPVERLIYRLLGIDTQEETSWKTYAGALLLFNLVGFLFLYLLLRLQHSLPLNPLGLSSVAPGLCLQYRDQLHHQHQLAELQW